MKLALYALMLLTHDVHGDVQISFFPTLFSSARQCENQFRLVQTAANSDALHHACVSVVLGKG